MEIKGKVHCLFEQSGTFKHEFVKFGIPAEDYDIQNNFGETDHVIDLFIEIEKAYDGKISIFDDIKPDDLIMAFFPCIYFSANNSYLFDGTWQTYQQRGMTERQINEAILQRSKERQHFYEIALKLFAAVHDRGLRMIVENPYSTIHYLHNNFPYKSKLIDKNRRLRGDYFAKPTQYWFENCEPTFGQSYVEKQKPKMTVAGLTGHTGNLCDEDRSMISPDYARNFICDFILGEKQSFSQPSLFDD